MLVMPKLVWTESLLVYKIKAIPHMCNLGHPIEGNTKKKGFTMYSINCPAYMPVPDYLTVEWEAQVSGCDDLQL